MRKREPASSFDMCTRRFGDSFDGLEPCHTTMINSCMSCSKLPESKGWREYRWIDVKRGRSHLAKDGNLKSMYISTTKLQAARREVGGVHSTDDVRDNKTLN